MYVCICNALNEASIRDTAGAGARSVQEVYDALGVRPQCGKCIPVIRDMVREDARLAAVAD
ncbi:MAG TPA: (2Fe-2S)-binding protein [Alphaproteobacteria bacterium]|nr:(2Fe-2S)-binding protein [Alphaproteobacteria bacterium]